MVTVVEFVRFRSLPGHTATLRQARTAALVSLQRVPGFRAAYLVSLEHDEWLDVTVWDTPSPPADWRDSVVDYTNVMGEVLGEESGILIDAAGPRG
jgi:heme-degrading monooxygenase HmoA